MGELLATDEKGRRALLNSLKRRDTGIVDYVEVGATELLAAVREQQREGIIGK